MHAAPRALAGFLALLAGPALRGGEPAPPPIFAPQAPIAPIVAAHPGGAADAGPALSARVRGLLGEASRRALAEARAFELPAAPPAEPVAEAGAAGVVQLPRYVVKALRVPGAEAAVPEVPRLKFGPVDRIDRGVRAGVTTHLLRSADGRAELNLNLLQLGGAGLEHGRDFMRAEIELRLRF